ncbi:MAG: 50S ribosomal protein L30 [Geminicoccaceae bacterium]
MADKVLEITQIGSPIGRPGYQRQVLISLGLNKIGRRKVWKDCPEVRGRIAKVHHLVKVSEAAASEKA